MVGRRVGVSGRILKDEKETVSVLGPWEPHVQSIKGKSWHKLQTRI